MATYESFTLGGTELNDSVSFILESFDPGNAAKRPEWVSGGDSNDAVLARDPLVSNREVTVKVRVVQQATMDLALSKLGTIIDLLEEAEKQPNGLACVWTPASSTKSYTLRCLSGEVQGVPVTQSGDEVGWFQRSPVITLKLTCKPYGEGSETTTTLATASTLPLVTGTLASVAGDVPALGRLIVTDAATQNRRHVEWGIEQRYYNAATALLIDSEGLTVSGFAGTVTTRTGAYDNPVSGTNVIQAALTLDPTTICGTGNQSHVGTFRVKARVYASSTSLPLVRLSWQEGNGPFRPNAWASPAVGAAFSEVDLGVINIPAASTGTQRWSGRIEAYHPVNVTGETLDVDALYLIPAGEGYGKARAVPAVMQGSGILRGHDQFTSMAGSLNARVAPAGGTWVTAGAATDFAGSSNRVIRSTTSDASPRLAALGSTNYTDTVVTVDWSLTGTQGQTADVGVVARYVDANNYLVARVKTQSWGTSGYDNFAMYKVVAGVSTLVGREVLIPPVPIDQSTYVLRLTVTAGGVITGQLEYFYSVIAQVTAQDSVAATGGALATGKPGFRDFNPDPTAVTRYYDRFRVAEPPAEDIVIYSTRSCQITDDEAIRADSTNTYWGPIQSYRGSGFFVPPAGQANRTSRVAVKARRNDVDSAADDQIADALTVAVAVTPRYSVIPR